MSTTVNNINPLPQRSRRNINRILSGRPRNSNNNNNKEKKQTKKLRKRVKRLARKTVRRRILGNKGLINRTIQGMPISSIEKAYAMCRLNPFRSMGLTSGIPDGSDVRRILLDHRMINTFTIGSSQSLRIAITPTIPSSIWWSGDAETRLNGALFPFNNTGWTSSLFRPICQPEWRDLPVSLQNTESRFNPAMALFHSTKARIVTVGWNLMYTGATINNSGVIILNSQQFTMGDSFPNPGDFAVVNSQSESNKTFTKDQILIRVLNDFPAFGAGNNNQTRTISLRSGAHGVLRHSAPEYEWCPVTNNMCFPASANDERHAVLMSQEYSTESTMGHWPQISFNDPGWASTLISINGATVGSTIALDTIYCIEYCPSLTSGVFPIAKEGPNDNQKLMQHVDNAAKSLPIAKAGSAENESVTTSLVNGISNAMKLTTAVAPLIF